MRTLNFHFYNLPHVVQDNVVKLNHMPHLIYENVVDKGHLIVWCDSFNIE